tara:strand:- start:306 stop:491 length:186 start_codon:yes stop_codon:yes gene_type:complete
MTLKEVQVVKSTLFELMNFFSNNSDKASISTKEYIEGEFFRSRTILENDIAKLKQKQNAKL